MVTKDPLVFLVDTPGILVPKIETPERGLILGLIGSVKP